jgi:hypothetical protein
MAKKTTSKTLPCIHRKGDCHQLIVDGSQLILLAGEMQNSSASSLEYMEKHGCWERFTGFNCNAALVPVYWELVEPSEGRFDFSLVTGIIHAARRRGLRLVLLWFGTWKNSTSSYVPAYVKTDLRRFPRCQAAPGRNSRTISPFSQAACQADSRAFAKLMEHIRKIDADQQTVLMIQVQNETGLLGADRDYSPLAEKRFGQQVPADLMKYLCGHLDEIHPSLRAQLARPAAGRNGSWSETFDSLAGEAFMAWHIGQYVESVIAAGKSVYPLPMFVNAWLGGDVPAGVYPSGGPVARMLDVWRAAAPSVDAFAPDNYAADFKGVCADFARPFHPLIVPESVPPRAAQQAFWTIAQCKGLCFSPFGIDHPHCWPDNDWQAEGLAETYALLREMMPLITAAQAQERIRGVLQTDRAEDRVSLGGCELTIRYMGKSGDGHSPGAGLILQLGDDEFVVAGRGFSVAFVPGSGQGGQADFLWAEQGHFQKGKWIADRRLNGDDTWDCTLRLTDGPELSARRGKLYRHR